MADGNDIYKEWERLLRKGERLTPEQRERFTMLTLAQLGRDIKELKQIKEDVKRIKAGGSHKEIMLRLEILERYSIFMFAQRHPKWAIVIVILFLIFLNAWFVSGFRQAIFQLLGFPIDLIP